MTKFKQNHQHNSLFVFMSCTYLIQIYFLLCILDFYIVRGSVLLFYKSTFLKVKDSLFCLLSFTPYSALSLSLISLSRLLSLFHSPNFLQPFLSFQAFSLLQYNLFLSYFSLNLGGFCLLIALKSNLWVDFAHIFSIDPVQLFYFSPLFFMLWLLKNMKLILKFDEE